MLMQSSATLGENHCGAGEKRSGAEKGRIREAQEVKLVDIAMMWKMLRDILVPGRRRREL